MRRREPRLDEFLDAPAFGRTQEFPVAALIRDGWLRISIRRCSISGRPSWMQSASSLSRRHGWPPTSAVGLMIWPHCISPGGCQNRPGSVRCCCLPCRCRAADAFGDYRSLLWQIAALSTLTLIILLYVVLTNVRPRHPQKGCRSCRRRSAGNGRLDRALSIGGLADCSPAPSLSRQSPRALALGGARVLATAAASSLFGSRSLQLCCRRRTGPPSSTSNGSHPKASEALASLWSSSASRSATIRCRLPVSGSGGVTGRPESVFIAMMAGVLVSGFPPWCSWSMPSYRS